VQVTEPVGGFGTSGYGASRFDEMTSFGSSYSTPGWQRAQARRGSGGFTETGAQRYGRDADAEDEFGGAARRDTGSRDAQAPRRAPLTIEGELIAKSTGTTSPFAVGDRVFHLKFGNGNVTAIDGNKLTIAFDKAGEKRVVDSFIDRV
jgi:DNA helicase-2/ATP-dependent DNA helicase PcrA